MNKKQPTQISSLSEFIEWVNQLGPGNYLFRGVPNAEYRIQASAFRRPKKGARSLEKFLQINRDLITDARLRGHGERNGQELEDLEILAELQHFGAATCLIDFTRNAQVALYFACEKDPKWEKNTQDSEKAPDGKVYVVRNVPLKLKKVTPDLLKEKICYFLHYTGSFPLYYWEPRYQNNRIIAQQSIFVFGRHQFDENNACIIEESCKKDILLELERASGITQAMLFPDFDGFARLHREDTPYTEPVASGFLNRGLQAFEEGRYDEAITHWDKAIELGHQDSETYRWRAVAKSIFERDEEAIDDYNKTIEIEPGWDAYYERAIIFLRLKRYQQAIADFSAMIEIEPSRGVAYEGRGEALLRLKRYQQAIADFSKLIEIEPNFAGSYVRRGRAEFELGQHQEALADFNTALRIDPADPYVYQLRGKANEQLGNLEGAKEDFKKSSTKALTKEFTPAPHTDKVSFVDQMKELVDQNQSALQRIEERIAERT